VLWSSQYRDGEVPRLEKRTKWSVFDGKNQEIRVAGATLFESHDKDGNWLVVAFSAVYDRTGTDLLFRATSSKVVIKPQSAHPRSCIVRTHYRISCAASDSGSNVCDATSPAQLAMNAWVNKMRTKDDTLKRSFIAGIKRGQPVDGTKA
jgi:hypothetical protein